ncbi:MAG: hypothetical protein ACLRXQ_01980 [Phascolarctobacterium faecium]
MGSVDEVMFKKYKLIYGLDKKLCVFPSRQRGDLKHSFVTYEKGLPIVGYNWEPT